MKPFNATIAYTCEIYQRSDVLAKYIIDKKNTKIQVLVKEIMFGMNMIIH